MMMPLTPMQSRVLAVGLLALVLAFVGVLLVAPVIAQQHRYDDRIAELGERLQRYLNVAQTQSATQNALNQIKRQGASTRYYLRSDDETLASAELQEHIKRVIDRSGGQLVSTQVLSSQRAEHANVATVRVNLHGDIEVLHKVLHGLETGRPMLLLDNVSIGRGSRMFVTRARQAQPEVQLQISLEASGYMRRQAP